MARIYISAGTVSIPVELNDTPTASQLMTLLPFSSTVNRWGEEIYFATPVEAKLESGARAEVYVGDVAYWPPGKALCVFFGRTPASVNEEPCAASPVNVVGRVVGSAKVAAEIRSGSTVTVSVQLGKE
jgi:hypothetical protein